MSSFIAFALKGRQTCQFIFGANMHLTPLQLSNVFGSLVYSLLKKFILSLAVSHSFSKNWISRLAPPLAHLSVDFQFLCVRGSGFAI